jgi:hypothetical protein
MHKLQFTFAIEGPGVTPESVRLRDLYEALSLVEATLAVTARQLGASDSEELTVSLTGVEGGSNRLRVATSPMMFRAAGVITSALATDDYSQVPAIAQARLRKLWQKSDKQAWDFRFVPVDNGITEAEITRRKEILKPGKISGMTTLFGKCIDAGGATRLTVRLQFANGEFFTASVADIEMARQLGARLHEWVGLQGEARWNAETWSLESFRATRVTDYCETDLVTAFERLATAAGDIWDEVDAEEYVQDQRADAAT